MAASVTPKSASTRLLTMKFMQRAAASASSTSPATPKSEGENSSKRRKVSHAGTKSSAADQLFDQAAIQAAVDEEERKRQALVEKQALELGDSRWVLSLQTPVSGTGQRPKQPLNIVQVGFAQIDGLEGPDENGDQDGESKASGRYNFRRFNMKKKAQNSNKESPSSADSSDDSSSDASSPRAGDEQDGNGGQREDSSKGRSRSGSSLQRKKSVEKARAQEFAEKRRKKEVKLNKLTSISSAGSGTFRSSAASSKIACHRCKQPGHKIANCPKGR